MCGENCGSCACKDGMTDASKKACGDSVHMGEYACNDRSQCFEPCGCLGKDSEFARVVPESVSCEINKALGL